MFKLFIFLTIAINLHNIECATKFHGDIEKNIDVSDTQFQSIYTINEYYRRQKRSPVPQSPIFNILKMTPASHHKPHHFWDIFDIFRDTYPDPTEELLDEYDFIVIGAGSAGSTIAGRLSENENWSILVIEAGGPESLLTDMPIMTSILPHTRFNWNYKMEKQNKMCQAMENRQCAILRGKGVGGSSLINYMIYTRGNKKDWDEIEALGNPGWSYEAVLPYFLKSEKAKLDGLDPRYHNKNGDLAVENVQYRTKLSDAFLDAGKELGYNVTDYNQENQMGFAIAQINIENGRRCSAAKAFLRPNKHRKNLHVMTYSTVTKIRIDSKTKTAESVKFQQYNKKYEIRAKKEIIISAGSLISPQLLMLSGVGPKDHLQEMGIDVINDLPVGQTLRDHIIFPGLIFFLNQTGISPKQDNLEIDDAVQWSSKGIGPLAATDGFEAISFLNTGLSEDIVYPDIEIAFRTGSIVSGSEAYTSVNIRKEFFEDVYGDIGDKDHYLITLMVLNTKSSGYIKLVNKDPFTVPKFYFNVDDSDIDTLVEGVKLALTIANTKAMKKYGSTLHDRKVPGCTDHTFGTDDYWKCAIKYVSIPGQHHVGSCKMGPSSDSEAVVSSRLEVNGIKRLRVADLSILPLPTSSHTNALAIMIGEKLADFIKDDWK